MVNWNWVHSPTAIITMKNIQGALGSVLNDLSGKNYDQSLAFIAIGTDSFPNPL